MNTKRTLISTIIVKIVKKIKFFGQYSSLHGVGSVCSMYRIPFLKRFFWFLILLLCCLGAGSILLAALQLYTTGAVSYYVETDYLEWNTKFPAVTLCEIASDKHLKSQLTKHKISKNNFDFFKDVSFWNTKYCKSCVKCVVNESCVEDFQHIVEDVRMECHEMLTDCWWNEEPFKCCDRFRAVATEYGTCYSFNSRIEGGDSKILVVNRRVGLPRLVFTTRDEVAIKVHAPEDLVSTASDNVLRRVLTLPLVTDLEIILKAEETINDVSTYSLSPGIRGCLFSHERPAFAHEWPFKLYTHSACVWYCRAVAQAELCNCTHHFMPKLGNYPTCSIQGLVCLYQISQDNKKNILLQSLECPTKCPMACDEIIYKIVHMFNTRSEKTPENRARGNRGIVRLIQLPVMRVRRQAYRDMLGLVVDIGSVGGVFFGASLLSVLEIVYLLCLRRRNSRKV